MNARIHTEAMTQTQKAILVNTINGKRDEKEDE